MLLMLCADPQRRWPASELAREMRVEPAWAEPALNELARRGLLAADGTTGETGGASASRYHYAPASPALDEAVRQLARTYAELRVSVIEFIFSLPEEPIRSFADAFRLRKERTDG